MTHPFHIEVVERGELRSRVVEVLIEQMVVGVCSPDSERDQVQDGGGV